VDHLAARWGFGPFRRGVKAREATGTWRGHALRLLKPTTYMNLSGAALAPLVGDGRLDPASELLVLVDDVALPLGTFRLRGAGSPGGHNGLKSIEATLRRRDYARLRIGVGPVPAGVDDLADFVLGEFSRAERRTLEDQLDRMADACECWVEEGIEKAMSRFNAT